MTFREELSTSIKTVYQIVNQLPEDNLNKMLEEGKLFSVVLEGIFASYHVQIGSRKKEGKDGKQ